MQEQDGQFFLLAESSPDAILVGAQGLFVYLNPAAVRLFGATSADQLLGQPILERIHPDDRLVVAERAQRVCERGEGATLLEETYLRLDGTPVAVEVAAVPFRFHGDDGALVFVRDITLRKRAQDELLALNQTLEQRVGERTRELLAKKEQLREALALNENILQSSPAGILAYRHDGQCVLANPAAAEIIGGSREQLLQQNFHRLGSWQVSGLQVAAGRVLAGGVDERFEVHFTTTFGHEIWAMVQFSRFESGGEPYLLTVMHDVTDQRLAEERTRQAATVFENARESVIIADLQGKILAVNKAFTEINGYGEDEVLGGNPRLLQSGRQGTEFYQAMWGSLLSTGQWQGEIWNRRKNGEVYPAWTTITTVRDERGHPTHYVAVTTDISQLKRSEEQLARLAHYDPLTSLPNRLLLQSRLSHALERAQRQGRRAAALVIDLDHFKTINDSLGHVKGDQLLVEVAARFGERVRDEDTLGRLGGDEFLVIIEPIGDPEEAALVARDLLAALSRPFSLGCGREIYLGASVGISIYPEDGTDPAELLRDADAAMYRGKEQGRNRFCFYTSDLNAKAIAQLEIESSLRRALERNEFVLHYQPKADLRTGLVYGAEALIRWQPEGRDLIPPGRFIPLAEKTGLIIPIGNWVIDTACRQLRDWRDAGMRELRLAVNVSGRQFHSGDLASVVAEALVRYGVPASSLELELTESILMEDPETTVSILKTLKQIGVHLSLDDFGTGYSSFAYLSRFPIDTLKIDQSFVRDIVSNPQAAMIAVSIIDLAHRLHLKVVAEGVETEAQLGYLRQQDCDEMQGYYFMPPLPVDAFEALMRQGTSLTLARTTELEARTLLLVDDEPAILSSLRRLLRQEGYRILIANSGHEGLELLATHSVQVIVSDQRMPGMTGTDFLSRVKDMHPNTVRMVLSGYSELGSVTQAVNGGAIYKFLHKPWDDTELREHIRDAFRYYEKVVQPRCLPHDN